MAEVKITALSAIADPASTDVLPICDVSADITHKVSIDSLLKNAAAGTAAAPAFAFDADPNTGMYRSGADALAFSTGGTGRLFIDSSGYVGIGNSNPINLLDVEGTTPILRILANGNTASTLNLHSRAGATTVGLADIQCSNVGHLIFSTGTTSTTERLRIDSSGNVKIGGTSSIDTGGLSIETTDPSGGLNIISPNNGRGDIFFGDADDKNVGQIRYSHVNNNLTIRTNTLDRLVIDSSGRVGIGTSSPGNMLHLNGTSPAIRLSDTGANGSAFSIIEDNNGLLKLRNDAGNSGTGSGIAFDIDASERMEIDNSGRLLVGTSTARANLFNSSITTALQVEGTTDNNSAILVTTNQAFPNGPRLDFAKSRGSTVGSNTLVNSGDNLGSINFQGSDGSQFVNSASIQANVDGTPGANDMPGRLVFSTTADGGTSPTEKMRITSTGQVRLAGAGITFNGDTATANELDDYEEGSWTPTLPNGGTVTSVINASYTKVGRLVTAYVYMQVSSIPSNTDRFEIGGLPFNGGISDHYGGGNITYSAAFDTDVWRPIVNQLSDEIYFHRVDGTQTAAYNSAFSGLSQILLQVAYFSAS